MPSSVRNPVEGAPWPVMVWFYPGGFTNGTSHMRQFGPEWLVAKGVVLVTVTYRVGALGQYGRLGARRAGLNLVKNRHCTPQT